MAKSDILETQCIAHLFGGSAMPQPTQWWIAIYSADPTDALTATTPTPITGRVQITAWTRTNNQAANTNIVEFPPVPASQTWTVSHYAIYDAQTSGRPLYHGQFRITKTLEEGDILVIAANQLIIREN